MAEVGGGATIQHWTDRTACTVIKISKSGKTVWMQEDHAKRVDNNGMSDQQEYEYSCDPNGKIYKATLRKDGCYRLTGTKNVIRFDVRRKYYDYSF